MLEAGEGGINIKRLMEELEALKDENRALKAKTGGPMSADDDERMLQAYLAHLSKVIAMRQVLEESQILHYHTPSSTSQR